MKKHKDLTLFLKSHGLRMTSSKKLLLQFFIDHQNKNIPAKEVHQFLLARMPDLDRTTIYRNIEKFLSLGIIQELELPSQGKIYQYIFDKKARHYYICKSCGKTIKGQEAVFKKIEKLLKQDHDFKKANLSVVFYGRCAKCEV